MILWAELFSSLRLQRAGCELAFSNGNFFSNWQHAPWGKMRRGRCFLSNSKLQIHPAASQEAGHSINSFNHILGKLMCRLVVQCYSRLNNSLQHLKMQNEDLLPCHLTGKVLRLPSFIHTHYPKPSQVAADLPTWSELSKGSLHTSCTSCFGKQVFILHVSTWALDNKRRTRRREESSGLLIWHQLFWSPL